MMATKTPESLMRESARMIQGITTEIQASRESEEGPGDLVRYAKLHLLRDRVWSRYLRRWADACENGYQGDWFAPWLSQKAER